MNIQHNCADNKCNTLGSRPVYQERQLTEQTRPAVSHIRTTDDLVLNTAQMRDAIHLQHFRVSSDTLDVDHIIHQSAIKELASLKVSATTSDETQSTPSISRRPRAQASVNTAGVADVVPIPGWVRPRPRMISNLAAESSTPS